MFADGGQADRSCDIPARAKAMPSGPREQPDDALCGVVRGKPCKLARLPRCVVADEPDGGDPRCVRSDRILRRLRFSSVRRGGFMGGDCSGMRSVMCERPCGAECRQPLGGDDESRRDHCERHPGDSKYPHPLAMVSSRQHDPPAYIGPGPGFCNVFAPRLRRKRANARPPGLTLSCSQQRHWAHVTAGVSRPLAHPHSVQ